MKIGVIGGGVVGRATARTYLEHHEVRVHDKVEERATHTLQSTLECDLVFVCLPTPRYEEVLACDVSCVSNFFAGIPGVHVNLVLRSTVPIGTTRKLREEFNLPNLVHSPEFLTSRCSVTDAMLPARNIIGVPSWHGVPDVNNYEGLPAGESTIIRDSVGGRCGLMLNRLYKSRFPGVPLYMMTSDESEAVKLFTNGFFAVKIAFFNEVRALADKLGLDWERVLGGVLSDGRISHNHTQVPGPDGQRGFGGACLPKDLANLIQCLYDAETSSPYLSVCNSARMRNEHLYRGKPCG